MMPISRPGTFEEFVAAVHHALNGNAAAKGYHDGSIDGPNPLYAFVEGVAGGPGHALGEIVYKATRYAAKRNREDIVKIAAWAYLIYLHHSDKDGTP